MVRDTLESRFLLNTFCSVDIVETYHFPVLLLSRKTIRQEEDRKLGDGSNFCVRFSYKVQPLSDGLAQAFILGEEFIGDGAACLILGDNIFHGSYFIPKLEAAIIDA